MFQLESFTGFFHHFPYDVSSKDKDSNAVQFHCELILYVCFRISMVSQVVRHVQLDTTVWPTLQHTHTRSVPVATTVQKTLHTIYSTPVQQERLITVQVSQWSILEWWSYFSEFNTNDVWYLCPTEILIIVQASYQSGNGHCNGQVYGTDLPYSLKHEACNTHAQLEGSITF